MSIPSADLLCDYFKQTSVSLIILFVLKTIFNKNIIKIKNYYEFSF